MGGASRQLAAGFLVAVKTRRVGSKTIRFPLSHMDIKEISKHIAGGIIFAGLLFLVFGVPSLVINHLTSNANKAQASAQLAKTDQAYANQATNLVNDANQKLAQAASAYDELANNMDNECVWESDNISEEAGNICNNNAVQPWYAFFQDVSGGAGLDIDYGLSTSSPDYIQYSGSGDVSSIMDSYPKSDTTAREQLMSTIISRRNTVWSELFGKGNAMFTAIENECAWLNANVSPGAGSQCQAIYTNSPAYHYANGWDYTWNESN